MKKLTALVLALLLGLTVCGCSSETKGVDGGFIRETYSGIIKEQLTENGSEYIRVDTGNNEVIDFLLTDFSEIVEGQIFRPVILQKLTACYGMTQIHMRC